MPRATWPKGALQEELQIMQLSSIRVPTEHIAVQKSSYARDRIENTVVLIHRFSIFSPFFKTLI
jgi:hypothetical protein